MEKLSWQELSEKAINDENMEFLFERQDIDPTKEKIDLNLVKIRKQTFLDFLYLEGYGNRMDFSIAFTRNQSCFPFIFYTSSFSINI